jgi:8-oxo-dGTP pyrophosphatase MutT (NUDIX family)
MNKLYAAGFIVIRPSLDEVLVLVKDGVGDIPKGQIDESEDPLEAAIRECREETQIQIKSDSILRDRIFDHKKMRFFVAVQNGNPLVLPNPESGMLEHDFAYWADWKDAYNIMPVWLKPVVQYGNVISKLIGNKR